MGRESSATDVALHQRAYLSRFVFLLAVLALGPINQSLQAAEGPEWLPRYDVAIHLDIVGRKAHVTQHVTWTNRHQRPAKELIFNAHSAYEPPAAGRDRFSMEKMIEMMRMTPKEVLWAGRSLDVQKIRLIRLNGKPAPQTPLNFRFDSALPTALHVDLPAEVCTGHSVCIAIEFVFNIPQKQGRWSQWKGVTCLSNWLPVLAYYNEDGWQPTPFIAWHQPFFNEAGVYDVHLRLPADQKVGTSGSVRQQKKDGEYQELWIGPVTAREFSLVASNRFKEHVVWADQVKITCLAFPEHAHYGEVISRIAARAVEAYNRWFGPYPYSELYFAESFFGWNGNECSGLVMVDERVFSMPHLAENYVEYLISHETCHQWFYNLIGTDGYRETFMDEAFANHFAHRLINRTRGKNNRLFNYPKNLGWLPNVNREDYRFTQFYNAIGRDSMHPPLQEMEKYRHVVNLFSATYDRGGKIVGMIEDRLGETAFFDFMRDVCKKYRFQVLFAADLQRELEEYTGRTWEPFFQRWLRDKGLTDWTLQSAEIVRFPKTDADGSLSAATEESTRTPCKAVIYLKQQAEYDEPTTLGFRFHKGDENYPVRIPIIPQTGLLEIDSPPARIESLPDRRIRVEVLLPEEPTQIAVDPDQILPDKEPSNNHWKPRTRVRITPFYTFLDEADLTSAYDRWNCTVGTWFYAPPYPDPWFSRAAVIGLRAGTNRTQQFSGGFYTGYRPDFRDVAAGFDARTANLPFPKTEMGVHAETGLFKLDGAATDLDRASLWSRYVIQQSTSLYTAPMHYVETFASWQQNFLPLPRNAEPGGMRFEKQSNLGIHYHIDYLTPYWDADRGFKFDITYAAGFAILGQPEASHQVAGQLSWAHVLPPGLGYLSQTQIALRVYGAAATPTNALMFSLGGNRLFRGFDLRERQGSAVWIGSAEWRFPLFRDMNWTALDRVFGLQHLHAALFYDVGDIYLNERSIGSVAHAVGVGLRADVAWFSLIERSMFRLDVARTINASTPFQVWLGIQHAF